jgi:hypothetical protein
VGEVCQMKPLTLLLLTIFIVGCQPAPQLRVDDLFFGNKRVGRQAENPSFRPGESFDVHFKVRGLTPNKDGYGALSKVTKFTHPMDGKAHNTKDFRFKITSEFTHVESDPMTFVVPEDAEGAGELIITVTDETIEKVIEVRAPYTISKS